MKRFLTIIILVLASVMMFGQTPTNYKEGDFTGKQVKAKTIKVNERWVMSKGTDNSLQFTYQNGTTPSLTLSTTGAVSSPVIKIDTASFSTTVTRAAVYIAGNTAGNIFVVSPKAPSTAVSGKVGTGEYLNWRSITDSLIVTRLTGTTSGLSFSYIRIK